MGGSSITGLIDRVARWTIGVSSDNLNRHPSPNHSFSASIFLSSSRTLITMLFDWDLLHMDRSSSSGKRAVFLCLDPFSYQSSN